MNKNSELVEEDLWQAQIPFDTREMAIRSVISMFKSAQSNKIAKNISKYNIKPIKKKENIQIFHVDDKTIKIKDGILKMFTEKLTKYNNTIRTRMRDKKKLKKLFQNKEPCDSIIQYIKDTNMWYICLPIKDVESKVKQPLYDHVFLDPGVRTFQKGYSPQGIICDLGNKYYDTKILPLLEKSDKLKETKRGAKLRIKAKHLIDELHKKSANILISLFNTIIIPDFKTSHMVKKSETNPRKINSENARALLKLSHYKFRMHLKFQCEKNNKVMKTCTEEYTSITCGKCGNLHESLGSSKIYECIKCGLVIDRDLNGARNICLKYMELISTGHGVVLTQ